MVSAGYIAEQVICGSMWLFLLVIFACQILTARKIHTLLNMRKRMITSSVTRGLLIFNTFESSFEFNIHIHNP